jgi:hypothetical protein
MKKSLWSLLIILLAISVNANEKKNKHYYETMNQVDTSFDDSVRLKTTAVGDVFIVASDQYVVFHAIDKMNGKFSGFSKADTLLSGGKFKVVDMIRIGGFLTPYVQLQDSSKAYVSNLFRLNRYCYKEGQSPIPSKIIRQLDKGFEFREKPFWIILGISLFFSIIILIFFSKINRLFSLWAKKETVKKNIAGIAFFIASAFTGAVIGVTILFFTDQFKEFVMYLPQINFPTTGTFAQKLYWISQPLFIVFAGWLIFGNIRELGILKGLLLSLILIITGILIFWSSLILSFLVVIALIIIFMMSVFGSLTSNLGEAHTEVTYKEELGSTGMQSVKYTKSTSGKTTKSYN